MNKLFWAFQILVSLAFALFGLQKVFMEIPDLIAQGMLWIEDFPEWQVRTIGALEFLGVVGLNLPLLWKALPRLLVPISAGALALTMVGAIATHVLRADPILSVIITSILFAMCVALAVKRFREVNEAGATGEVGEVAEAA